MSYSQEFVLPQLTDFGVGSLRRDGENEIKKKVDKLHFEPTIALHFYGSLQVSIGCQCRVVFKSRQDSVP